MNEMISSPAASKGGRERGIERVLKLLAYLNARNQPVRVADLPKALGAPRSTTYELVKMLSEAGLLETSPEDSKVFFGRLMYIYGAKFLSHNSLLSRGRVEVDRLADLTGETCELCTLHHNRQAILYTRPGSRPMRISSEIGAQFPIPWTASGRLLLADNSEAEIGALVTEEDLALPDGDRLSLEAFAEECRGARNAEIVVTRGLINSFTQCLAAPITGTTGATEATICFVLPIDVEPEHRQKLERILIAASKSLSMGR